MAHKKDHPFRISKAHRAKVLSSRPKGFLRPSHIHQSKRRLRRQVIKDELRRVLKDDSKRV